MKEILSEKTEVRIEIVGEFQNRKMEKYKGTFRPHPGQKIYEMCIATGEVSEVTELKGGTIDFPLDGKPQEVNKRLYMKPHYLYAVAINKKNAVKKFCQHMLKSPNFQFEFE